MKIFLSTLLASTALVSSPAFADAAAQDPAANAGVVTMSKSDFDRLMSKMDSMQSQIDELKTGQAATTAQAQTAQAAAEEAKAAAAKPPKIDLGWAGNTKISGKAYFNVSNIDSESVDLAGNHTDSSSNGVGAELKRFYFQVDHKFDSIFSARLRTDMRYGTNGTSNDVLVYLKHAYLQATLAPEFWVKVGEADLPWVPFVEDTYGLRYIENVMIDRTKFGTSADWGVHVGGSFGKGLVNYAASAVNGAGYKTLARNSNTIDLAGRIDVHPIKPITLAVGGYTGKLGKSNDTMLPGTTQTASRFDALAAYTDKRVRAGIEYFYAKNWRTVASTIEDSADGWSAFGSFAFTPKTSVFARYDFVKPSRDLIPNLEDNYFNVGVNYKPIAPIDLSLVYKHDRVNNGVLSTSNGTIGGLDHGSYDEFGIFGQFVF